MKLILIKHSLPEIDADVPANMWKLSNEGRSLCGNLAKLLSSHAIDSIISSTEPKASETGQILANALGKPLRNVAGLHEHDRSDVGYIPKTEDFDGAVRSLFAMPGELVFGGETADEAHRRFSGAVDGVLRGFQGGVLAVVAHGTVISLYVARRTGADPYALWKRLHTPSFVVLGFPENKIIEVVDSVVNGACPSVR